MILKGMSGRKKQAVQFQKVACASCVQNDTIYIMGGQFPGVPGKGRHWYYAPGTDSWDSLPDMKYERPFGSVLSYLIIKYM